MSVSWSGVIMACGCSALNVRSQSPEDDSVETLSKSVQLVGDLAVPFGVNAIQIDSVGLVTGLPGTGSDPPPSPQRSALIAEMQTRGVNNPSKLLASGTAELVMVHAVLRPGIQKGDHFDVEVRTPSHSEGTSLRGGWLMEARLREMAVLSNQVHEGTPLGLAQGAVLVDPSGKEKVQKNRGLILNGGVAMSSRELGLVIRPEDRNVMNSALIGNAINRRFHSFDRGIKEGVAKPKTDQFIELKIHSRYKYNIDRYIRVVRCLPLRESATQQHARLTMLERQLLDPISSAGAAIRLEAMGKDGLDALHKGLASEIEEVRFYSAEALAYLDDSAAAAPLGQLARDVPAFRAYALTALSAMEDYSAFEALRDLLDAQSAETRYGAFRALWAMDERDPLVKGEDLNGQFSYHVLDTKSTPMVHVARSHRAEIVIFGQDQEFMTPLALDAGNEIMVNSLDQERISVTRFTVGQPDQKRIVSPKVDDVIRAIVDLGGTYPDVVQALQIAKSTGALASRFEMDALPLGGRRYLRKADRERQPETEETDTDQDDGSIVVGNPLPDLFSKRGLDKKPASRPLPIKRDADEKEKSKPFWSLFGKMVSHDD
jgi:flagellar basal body P-ring protein FlgI